MIFSTSQTNALKKAFNRTSGMRRIVLTTAVAVFGATAGIQMNLAHAQDDAPFCDQGDRGAQRGGSRSHHRMAQHEAGMPGMLGSPRHLDRMLNDVKATDEQRAQIKQIGEAARKDIQALHEGRSDMREQMLQIMTAPKVDEAAAESARQQMLATHDKVSKRSLQAMLEMSRVLTPEQRAQIAQRLKDRPKMGRRTGGKRGPDAGASAPKP